MKPQCKITQPFGANALTTYAQGGLKGHTGIDNSCGYGTPIYSYYDNEYVYKVLTKENPANDGSGFTGVFTLVEQLRDSPLITDFVLNVCLREILKKRERWSDSCRM